MENNQNLDMPEDIVHEILSRLPVKDLLHCKCVCKKWHAVIGSRSFINDQFHRDSDQDCLLVGLINTNFKRREIAMYPDDGRQLEVNYLSQLRNCDLLGPANGLFCAVSPLGRVAFFNPATRKMKLLPPIPLPEPKNLEFGFGIDLVSKDYKVVAFQKQREAQNFYCVYNSSSDSWKKTKVVDSLNTRVCMASNWVHEHEHEHDVVLNGVYYWINRNIESDRCESILAFDMNTENFKEILLPDDVMFKERTSISAYDDSIALLLQAQRCLDFWVIERDGLWSKRFSVELPQDDMWPHFVWKKNVVLLESLTFTRTELMKSAAKTSTLFLYDISTQKLRKLGQDFKYTRIMRVYSYKESLVSIEGEKNIADCVQDFIAS